MNLLDNKIAIITGASAGIGHAAAKLFASQGAKLVVGARRQRQLDELVTDIRCSGGEAFALAGDVKDEQYHADLVSLALETFGRVDVAFNNAGTLSPAKAITELTAEEWHTTLNTNLTGAFFGAKYQLRAMRETGGSIIFTSSFVGHTVGFPMQAAYAASKAGLVGLTKALASEYGQSNVRVNALLPGGTQTDMAKEFGDSPEVREFVNHIHALKRTANATEIAQSALYLASDMSSFMTGAAMLVDGGVSICKG